MPVRNFVIFSPEFPMLILLVRNRYIKVFYCYYRFVHFFFSLWMLFLLYAFSCFLNCCVVWLDIVAFSKVLTMYQIYHTWIHPSTILLYIPSFTPGVVSTGIFSICTHVSTVFANIHHPIPFPHLFLPPTGTNPSQGRTCSALLFSNLVNEKNVCLR
jgi:hypothetical protein